MAVALDSNGNFFTPAPRGNPPMTIGEISLRLLPTCHYEIANCLCIHVDTSQVMHQYLFDMSGRKRQPIKNLQPGLLR